MCKRSQDNLKEAVRKITMARLGRTYYGIPRKKPDSFDSLLRIWHYIPESLRVELRHILAPAFRKKALIVKDEKLIQEVDEYMENHKVEE
jgi:hypothetical protein